MHRSQIHKKVAQIFVTMHWSVATYSQKMLLELRRHNYVTPTNYLELVSGYKKYDGRVRGTEGLGTWRIFWLWDLRSLTGNGTCALYSESTEPLGNSQELGVF